MDMARAVCYLYYRPQSRLLAVTEVDTGARKTSRPCLRVARVGFAQKYPLKRLDFRRFPKETQL